MERLYYVLLSSIEQSKLNTLYDFSLHYAIYIFTTYECSVFYDM